MIPKYKLSARSLNAMSGVHPDLQRVVKRAIEITDVDFVVLEGLRTNERQAQLVKAGASRTMDSRHITGHAVDLGAWVDRRVAWDWPLYHALADAMKCAAREFNISIVWGGDWKRFPDGPHFELNRKEYP